QKRSLLNFSTIRGFEADKRQLRMLLVGIDINIQIAAIHRTGYSGGQTGLLRAFFFKLCNLLKAAITAIFVFDGMGRPSVKQGKKVSQHPRPLMEDFQRLITAFGFYYHDWSSVAWTGFAGPGILLPGEAEAELAQLDKLEFIDAIITEDSDAFVFGVTCVIHISEQYTPAYTNYKLRPHVEKVAHIFESSNISSEPLSLDEDGLLLIALMAGGDYDTDIPKCGAKIAHALAKCGLGCDLRHILISYAGILQEQHLTFWRNKIRSELCTNSSGFLDSCRPKLADNIPDSFPDARVVDLYTNPLTSWSFCFTGKAPNIALWIPREPIIQDISKFCRERLYWNTNDALKKRLTSNLWPGVAFKMISSVSFFYTTRKLSLMCQ
ncbi:PIN domain-like protein, partial [Mycena rebaudengoi]